MESMEIVGNIKDLLTTIVNIIAGNWDPFCHETDILLYDGDS